MFIMCQVWIILLLCTMKQAKNTTAVVLVLLLALEVFTNWMGGPTVGSGQITQLFVSVHPHINARDILLICSGTRTIL